MAHVKETSAGVGAHEHAGYKEQPETSAPAHMGGMHHMEIHPMGHGGWKVEHHMPEKMSKSGAFKENDVKSHEFMAGKGDEMMGHLHEHLGVPMEHEAMEEEPETGEI